MDPTGFNFRFRFALAGRTKLPFSGASTVLATSGGSEVTLRSSADADLSSGSNMVVLGGPYPAEYDARSAGEEWRDRLTQAFACVGIGADFGDRESAGGMVDSELARMSEAAGGWPVRNEVYGVHTFEGDRVPLFVSTSGDFSVGIQEGRLRLAIDSIAQRTRLSDRERLAFDLYSLSRTVADKPDARFVVLMMALEALIDQRQRSDVTIRHIDTLVDATREAEGLTTDDREPLMNGLRALKRESARRAGMALVESLRGRTYLGMSPDRLYKECYDLRNAIVHPRSARPSRDVVGRHGAVLETLVAHLIAGRALVDDVLGSPSSE
ncbi:MAG TPA: hypothetical protein VGN48_16850 [Pedococcus sp.]|nr:hypothetical protein [Pedococcus sp.]